MMNKKKFDSYPPDIQKAIVDAGQKAEDYQINYITDAWAKSLKDIKAAGVQVNEIKNIKPFQDAVAHIVDKYEKEIGHGLVQKVRDLAN